MFDKRLVFVLLFVCIAPTIAMAKPMDIMILAEYPAVDETNRRQVLDSLIRQLTGRLDRNSRLSLSLYDSKTHEIEALEPVTEATGQHLMSALDRLSHGGIQRNPAVSLEQTIYQLRTTGRDQAAKLIVMLSDGVVDTGDTTRNNELAQWMRQELSTEAGRSHIRIDWLTFSDAANYRIIQTLTQKTGGIYFRAYSPAEVPSAIEAIMRAVSTDTTDDDTVTSPNRPRTERPSWPGRLPALENQWVLIASTGGLALLLLSGGFYLRYRRRSKTKHSVRSKHRDDSKARLRDLSHFTSLAEYDISDKRTYIGRHPREVTERSCIIIISDSSVGRNHAVIDCRDRQYWINDLDTVNGTYINGVRISGSRQLRNGDKIRFARFEFALTLPDTADIADPLGRTHTTTDTIPDDERTVFRSRR